jgi:hypothetical protein
MDATPQFDQVWVHPCDEEGNTITGKGRARVESSAFALVFALRCATS